MCLWHTKQWQFSWRSVHYRKLTYTYQIWSKWKRWRIILFVREDISAKVTHCDFPTFQIFYVEINLRRKKWLLNFSYNPPKNNIYNHLCVITKILDAHYGKYENVVFPVDFNAGTGEILVESFCEPHNLTSPTHSPT